jgi:predicted nucleic acid-binding protein
VNVVVDTSVWSLALRRARGASPTAEALQGLISSGRAVLLGLVRQELLSELKDRAQFNALRDRLRAFPDLELEAADHEVAALFFNRCRGRGVQGSAIDFLLCAAAARRRLEVFTTDRDFQRFAGILPIRLFAPT